MCIALRRRVPWRRTPRTRAPTRCRLCSLLCSKAVLRRNEPPLPHTSARGELRRIARRIGRGPGHCPALGQQRVEDEAPRGGTLGIGDDGRLSEEKLAFADARRITGGIREEL